MDDTIQKIIQQVGTDTSGKWISVDSAEKVAQLIIDKCADLNRDQSFELMGVVIDAQEGDGFDSVCLNTVSRVQTYLTTGLQQHFKVQQ